MEKSRIQVEQLFPDEWRSISESAHLAMFDEKRSSSMDRIDYALVLKDEKGLCGYCTCRELDDESVYWQYGGAFPGTHGTSKAVEVYMILVEWAHEKYKRITTLVENENVRYLKLAMHAGFRIIGCRNFGGKILVELLNERKA